MNQNREPLISVIIPVYNVENYLEQCLESVMNQTCRDLEIIVVDDASPDHSREIYRNCQKRDGRIRVIRKEKNAGLSEARNSGLEVCRGQFIYFLDSDDYIEPDMLEKMYLALIKNDTDMAICSYECVDKSGKSLLVRRLPDIARADTGQIYELLAQEKLSCLVQTKLYRRKIFDKIRFPAGKMYEDVFIFPETMRACRYVTALSEDFFKYRIHDQAFTKQPYRISHMDIVEAAIRMYCNMKRDGLDLKGYAKYMAYTRLIVAIKESQFGEEERTRIRKLRSVLIRYCGLHIKYTPMVFGYYWMRMAGYSFQK